MLPGKLNKKVKIIGAVLLFFVIIIGLVVFGKDTSTVQKSAATPLETVSESHENVDSFADSPLNESVIEKEQREKEEAEQKQLKAQHEKDLVENAIYLTFDDGPSEEAEELLDILGEYNMKATFFMLGPNMEDHPDVVKRTKDLGHGLALHGITHEVDQIYQDPSAPLEEMTEDQEILEDITGLSSDMVRLPYGSVPYLTEKMRYELDQEGFHIWDWNVDSDDWEGTDGSYVPQTIQKIEDTKEEGEAPVVLLHDKKETIEHLPELLDYIQKQGYKTKVLDNEMTPLTFSCEGRCYPIN